MHDHNLDDLIIENIEPKNSKLKSLLTIIALLIVILIVAIVLTRILLKTPENNELKFEQDSAELIAPELKLQETPKQLETKKEPVLSTPVEEKPKQTEVVKKEEPKPVVEAPVVPKVVETKKEPILSDISQQEIKAPEPVKEISAAEKAAQDAADIAHWESVQAKRKAEQEARAKAEKLAEEKAQKARAAEKKAKEEKEAREQAQREALQATKPVAVKPVPSQVSTGIYYVQVGAFKGKPSSRFLSVIRNNGYKYTMTKPNASGIKRLLVGPFKGKATADSALVRIKDRIHKRAFIVKR